MVEKMQHKYGEILEDNLIYSEKELRVVEYFQQDKNTNQIGKPKQQRFKDRVNVLESVSQPTPQSNRESAVAALTGLKKAFHIYSMYNLAEFEHFYKEELSNITVSRCERRTEN